MKESLLEDLFIPGSASLSGYSSIRDYRSVEEKLDDLIYNSVEDFIFEKESGNISDITSYLLDDLDKKLKKFPDNSDFITKTYLLTIKLRLSADTPDDVSEQLSNVYKKIENRNKTQMVSKVEALELNTLRSTLRCDI